MAVTWEYVKVSGDNVTADLIIWRRYRMNAPGMFELMLDQNPQIAEAHREGPFLPVGMIIKIPIDDSILSTWPGASGPISLTRG